MKIQIQVPYTMEENLLNGYEPNKFLKTFNYNKRGSFRSRSLVKRSKFNKRCRSRNLKIQSSDYSSLNRNSFLNRKRYAKTPRVKKANLLFPQEPGKQRPCTQRVTMRKKTQRVMQDFIVNPNQMSI